MLEDDRAKAVADSAKAYELKEQLKNLDSSSPEYESQDDALRAELVNVKTRQSLASATTEEFDRLKAVMEAAPGELEIALNNDLRIVRLEASIKYLDSPALLDDVLSKANEPDAPLSQERYGELNSFRAEIGAQDVRQLRADSQRKLNQLLTNQGLTGLGAAPPRPEKLPLMQLSSAAISSYCFASPVGPGAALGGGSFRQDAAGGSLCDGTNGGMADASFTEEQQAKKPVYFSVIQYFEVPSDFKQASFGFRLAFVPSHEPGKNPELLGVDEFESQPGYGTTFRFGGQQGLDVGGRMPRTCRWA